MKPVRLLPLAAAFGVAFLSYVAHADTGPPAGAGMDTTSVIALIGLVLGGLGMVLGGLSTVLHAIAPRTKTTVDDTIAADVDAAHAKLDELLGLVRVLAPVAAVVSVSTPAAAKTTVTTTSGTIGGAA